MLGLKRRPSIANLRVLFSQLLGCAIRAADGLLDHILELLSVAYRVEVGTILIDSYYAIQECERPVVCSIEQQCALRY